MLLKKQSNLKKLQFTKSKQLCSDNIQILLYECVWKKSWDQKLFEEIHQCFTPVQCKKKKKINNPFEY